MEILTLGPPNGVLSSLGSTEEQLLYSSDFPLAKSHINYTISICISVLSFLPELST